MHVWEVPLHPTHAEGRPGRPSHNTKQPAIPMQAGYKASDKRWSSLEITISINISCLGLFDILVNGYFQRRDKFVLTKDWTAGFFPMYLSG